MRLYEIKEEFFNLMTKLEEDEITEEEFVELMESLDVEFETKIDNIACIYKNLTSDIDAIKAEISWQNDRKKKLEKECDRLKDYITYSMQAVGKDKIVTPKNQLSFRKSKSVEITNTDLFVAWAKDNYADLLKYKEPEPDKTKIKEVLSDGEVLEFAKIVENENLQIGKGKA